MTKNSLDNKVSQNKAIDVLEEIPVERNLLQCKQCTEALLGDKLAAE